MKRPGGKGSAMARLGFFLATMSNLQNVSTFFVYLFTCWGILIPNMQTNKSPSKEEMDVFLENHIKDVFFWILKALE